MEETKTSNNTTAIAEITLTSGLDKQKSDSILDKFNEFAAIADEWGVKARSIVVTDSSQKDLMKQAREARLLLKNKRVEIDKVRKELKEQSLREGQAIDKIAKMLTGLIEPLEEYLDEQEKFAERKEAEIIAKYRKERTEALQPYMEFVYSGVDLGLLSEEDYGKVYKGAKLQYDQKVANEKKLEGERIERERQEQLERDRINLENEKLQQQAIENERLLQVERDNAEKERLANEEKLRLQNEENERQLQLQREQAENERKENEEKLRLQREENERLEREIRENKEREEKEKREAEEAERQKELAPDKDKLTSFVAELMDVKYPTLKSKKAQKIVTESKTEIQKMIDTINTKIKAL